MSANPQATIYRSVADTTASSTGHTSAALDAAAVALLDQCALMLKGRVNRFAGTRPWLREDVSAQANEALLSAALRWDDTKGPFVSYAKTAVNNQLIDLVETSGTIHIPRRMRDAARKDPKNHQDPEVTDIEGLELADVDIDTGSAETFESSYMQDLARVCATAHEPTLAKRLVDPIVTRTVFGPLPKITIA